MKLIRLVDNSNDGILENNFNDGFEIKPNSQIALQDITTQLDTQEFLVDHSNDNITFQYNVNDDTTSQSFNVPVGTYTKNNAPTLRKNIQDGLNRSQGYNFKQIGSQWDVDNKASKTRIQTRFCPNSFGIWKENTVSPYGERLNDAEISGAAGADIMSQSGAAVANDKNLIYSNQQFGKGSAVFRTRLRRLIDQGGVDSTLHGFEFGLSDVNPQQWSKVGDFTLPDATKTFNIRVRKATDVYQFNKKGSVNQDATNNPLTFVSGTRTNNDTLEIAIFENKIRGKLYRNDNTTPTETFFEEDLTVLYPDVGQNTPLYPYIIFHGSDANVRIDSYTRVFFDPFVANIPPQSEDEGEKELGALPSPPSDSKPNSRYVSKLLFESSALAEYLGFNNNSLLSTDPARLNFIYDSENTFKAMLKYDNIIVETMNLQLESYDGLAQGRRNTLASVPTVENSDGVIVYEPNNQNFLDIRNNESIIVRNLRVRILFSDLTDCPTIGLNSITLLIKDSDN